MPSERRRVAYVQTSAAVREPPPLVRVLVPLDQISDTSVPNVVRDLVGEAQIAAGKLAYRDVEALITSACVASDPELRDAPVRVLVVFVHTSATSVPNEVKVLEALDQTDDASVVVETTVAPTTNVLSIFTRSTAAVPQDMVDGQTPSGPAPGIE